MAELLESWEAAAKSESFLKGNGGVSKVFVKFPSFGVGSKLVIVKKRVVRVAPETSLNIWDTPTYLSASDANRNQSLVLGRDQKQQ